MPLPTTDGALETETKILKLEIRGIIELLAPCGGAVVYEESMKPMLKRLFVH